MEEDYFGNIAVPVDEEEEDAANDLTFGDIGDIKAGDDSSDAFWKPGHQQISNTIEAEKEALQKQRNLPREAALQSPNNVTQGNGLPYGDHFSASPKTAWERVSPLQRHAAQMPQPPQLPRAPYPQASLTQPVQSAEQLQLFKNQTALYAQGTIPPVQPQSQNPRMTQVPQVPSIPQPPAAQPLQPLQNLPPLPALPPQYRALGQQTISPQDYERTMLAYYENHARELLMRHKETAEMQLREAEAAQRIGVSFDRNKFDEHQNAVRQRILSDHYSRVNHLRYLVWQQTQGLTRLDQGITDRPRSLSSHANEANKVPTAAAESLLSGMVAGKAVRSNTTTAADSLLAAVQDALRIDTASKEQKPSENLPQQSHKMRKDKSQKPQRLLEIERQMAEAGLGPTKHRGPREKNRPRSEGGGRPGAKKKERRLESMTEKDQELVFRVHLRQVESSVVYKDDYYNAVLKKKERLGKTEIYTDMAERVRAMRQFARERGGEGRAARNRRSKRAAVSSSDHATTASPTHSDQNMKALATALGTVQSWNPRAPRRVMDFGVMEQGEKENGEGTKLLRDDESVLVRLEIERGYDIIATIHDIVRGESPESLEAQIKNLLSTLHVEDTRKGPSDQKKRSQQNTRFFATLCVIEKGREYLMRVMDLLDIQERVPVLQAAYENLGALLFSLQKTSSHSCSTQSGLPAVMYKTLQDPEISAQDCLAMLHSFIASHTSHRDALLTTFRSGLGSKLIFLCMQRISRGFHKHELQEEELSRANIERFSDVFTTSLQDIFEGAESVTRVWEVVASMDGLAFGEHKKKYRAELNNLLRSGAAPPPPGASSAQQQQQVVQ